MTPLGPFTALADISDDNCSWRLEGLLTGLDASLQVGLANLSLTEVCDHVELMLEVSPSPHTDAQTDALTYVFDQLALCAQKRCNCSQTEFDNDVDAIDSLLAKFGDCLWSVTEGVLELPLFGGILSTSYLWNNFVRPHNEYLTRVEASYDGSLITLAVTGETVRATFCLSPLPEVYYEAAKASGSRRNGVYDRKVLDLPEDVLTVVVSLFKQEFKLSPADYSGILATSKALASFSELLSIADRLNVAGLDESTLLAVTTLADGWSSSFTELVAAAHASLAPV